VLYDWGSQLPRDVRRLVKRATFNAFMPTPTTRGIREAADVVERESKSSTLAPGEIEVFEGFGKIGTSMKNRCHTCRNGRDYGADTITGDEIRWGRWRRPTWHQ